MVMCGRYGFSVKQASEVYERFAVTNTLLDYQPRFNVAPGQMNPVITHHSPTTIERMFWGLIPHWAKDQTLKFKTINARVEGLADKPVYRRPFRSQRCLVPATGFYEWDKTAKPSTPYYFNLKSEPLFAFAGLYDSWHDPQTGKELRSYTIITCPANSVVGKIHQRMPVILRRVDEETWLNPDIIEPERLYPLLSPYPDEAMQAYPVSLAVNNPKNDNEQLLKPVD